MDDIRIKSIAIVGLIINDICSRKGLRNEWAEIDPETRTEIANRWIDIIRKAFESK